MRKYYEILGVDYNADINQIKKRYRELVKKYHPDLNKNADGEMIKLISEAYINIIKSIEKKQKNNNNISNNNKKEIIFCNIYVSRLDWLNGFNIRNINLFKNKSYRIKIEKCENHLIRLEDNLYIRVICI